MKRILSRKRRHEVRNNFTEYLCARSEDLEYLGMSKRPVKLKKNKRKFNKLVGLPADRAWNWPSGATAESY